MSGKEFQVRHGLIINQVPTTSDANVLVLGANGRINQSTTLSLQGPTGPQGTYPADRPSTFYGKGEPCTTLDGVIIKNNTLSGTNAVLGSNVLVDTLIDYKGQTFEHFVDVDLRYNSDSTLSTATTDLEYLYLKLYVKNEKTQNQYKLIHNIRIEPETGTNDFLLGRRLPLGWFHDRISYYQFRLDREDGTSVTPTSELQKFYLRTQFKYIKKHLYVGEVGYSGYQFSFWGGASTFKEASAAEVGDYYISMTDCKVYRKVPCDTANVTKPNGFVWPQDTYYVNGDEYTSPEESILVRDSSGLSGDPKNMTGLLGADRYYASNIITRTRVSIVNTDVEDTRELFMYDIPLGVSTSSDEDINQYIQNINVSGVGYYKYIDFTIKESKQTGASILQYGTSTPTQLIEDDYNYGVFVVDKSNTQPLKNITTNDDIDILTYLNNNLSVTRYDKTFASYSELNNSWSNVTVTDSIKISSGLFKYNATSNTTGYWILTDINKELSNISIVGDMEWAIDPYLFAFESTGIDPETPTITLDGVDITTLESDIAKGFYDIPEAYIDLPTNNFEFIINFGKNLLFGPSGDLGSRVKPYDNSNEASPYNTSDIITGGGFSGTVVREFHRVDNDTWEVPTEWTTSNRTSCGDPVYDKIRYTLSGGNSTGYVRFHGLLLAISFSCGVDCCWDEIGKTDCGCCTKTEIPDCTVDGLSEWNEGGVKNVTSLGHSGGTTYRNIPCKEGLVNYKYPWALVKSSNSSTIKYNNLTLSKFGWYKEGEIVIEGTTDGFVTYELQVPVNISNIFVDTTPPNTISARDTNANVKVEVSANVAGGFVDLYENWQSFDDCDDNQVRYIRIRTANSTTFTLRSVYIDSKNCGPCCYEGKTSSIIVYDFGGGDITYEDIGFLPMEYNTSGVYQQGSVVAYEDGLWMSKDINQNQEPRLNNDTNWTLLSTKSEDALIKPWAIQTTVFSPISPVVTGDGAAYLLIPSNMNGKVIKRITANVITPSGNSVTDTGNTEIQIYDTTSMQDIISPASPIKIGFGNFGNVVTYDDLSNDTLTGGRYLRIDIDGEQTPPAQGLIVTIEGVGSIRYADPTIEG